MNDEKLENTNFRENKLTETYGFCTLECQKVLPDQFLWNTVLNLSKH